MSKILIDEAVVKQALEALEVVARQPVGKGTVDAIAALRKALAEQPRAEGTLAQQEPVAWMYEGDAEFDGNDWRYPTRVTTSKQVAEFHGGDVRPLYTSPPAQRTWVGLTDEERRACTQSPFTADNYLAIEAKLKEKNQ